MSTTQLLQIGTNRTGPSFGLHPSVLSAATAILGVRGSGKTSTGVVLCEEAQRILRPFVVIDPLDVWWGLRSSRNGYGPGVPAVVFGGNHGNFPLNEGDAEALADLLIDQPVPAVLSLRRLQSAAAQKRFVANFLTRLWNRKGEVGQAKPLLVVIDEASLFAPQGGGVAEAKSLGAIENIVRRGRASGFGVVLIDQRAAAVSKQVLSQCELLVSHRQKGAHDRKALRDWVRAHADNDQEALFMDSLAVLQTGEAWFWMPGQQRPGTTDDVFERVQVRQRHTWDSSATPAGQAKEHAPGVSAPVDLDAIRRWLSARSDTRATAAPMVRRVAPVAAVSHEQQIRELECERDEARRRVAELEEALAQEGRRQADRIAQLVQQELAKAGSEVTGMLAAKVAAAIGPARLPVPATTPPVRADVPRSVPVVESDSETEAGMPRGLLRTLTALAQAGRPITVEAVALRANLRARTGSFRSNLARARREGWIDGRAGNLQITAAGLARIAGRWQPLPTGTALLDWWYSQMPDGAARMLRTLVSAWPEPMTAGALATAAGLRETTGSFRLNLADLRKLELVTGPGRGMCASPELMAVVDPVRFNQQHNASPVRPTP